MLLEVGNQSRKIYEGEFETVLLEETSGYYRLESNRLITDSSCAAYLTQAYKRLSEEYERINSYLSPSTEPKLIEAMLAECLGKDHALALLTMPSSGLMWMIQNNKIDDLGLLYTMFSKRPESFELLKKHMIDYIITEGDKLVLNERLSEMEFVVELICLMDRVTHIYSKAMRKD
jgi:cullin 3